MAREPRNDPSQHDKMHGFFSVHHPYTKKRSLLGHDCWPGGHVTTPTNMLPAVLTLRTSSSDHACKMLTLINICLWPAASPCLPAANLSSLPTCQKFVLVIMAADCQYYILVPLSRPNCVFTPQRPNMKQQILGIGFKIIFSLGLKFRTGSAFH